MSEMICTTNDKNEAVWISHRKGAFDEFLKEIKENDENYSIKKRTISVGGKKTFVYVMTITQRKN